MDRDRWTDREEKIEIDGWINRERDRYIERDKIKRE